MTFSDSWSVFCLAFHELATKKWKFELVNSKDSTHVVVRSPGCNGDENFSFLAIIIIEICPVASYRRAVRGKKMAVSLALIAVTLAMDSTWLIKCMHALVLLYQLRNEAAWVAQNDIPSDFVRITERGSSNYSSPVWRLLFHVPQKIILFVGFLMGRFTLTSAFNHHCVCWI